MRLKLIVLILMLMVVSAVSAQTATPSPSPTAGCSGGVDIGNLNIGGQCTSNTIDSDTKSDVYRVMATASANINALPDQIRQSGPNGQSLVPGTSGAAQIFGYAKWLASPNTAQELLGKSLAPFGINVFVIFVIVTSLVAVWLLVNVIVLIIKVVSWFINQILKLVPFW